jgi:hypothetical protein
MEHNSQKRLSIARIFAAAASLEDTLTACEAARRSSYDALRVLESLQHMLGAHADVALEVTQALAQAKAHVERNAAAVHDASVTAQAVAKAMRFDAA